MQKKLLSALALVVLALSGAGQANAATQRTFVSGLGADTGTCSRTAPCRTFAFALANTLPSGEVVALDTAGYGPVTIDKAISLISPPGVYAGITTTVAFADGITVNAGPNDVVVLKGLSLSGLGLGEDGVQFNSGKALRVEGLTISGFTDDGVEFTPSAGARMTVIDSLVRDNAGYGIQAEGTLSTELARVGVEKTRLVGNWDGVFAGFDSRFNVRDSVATGNENAGFTAFSGSVINLENSLTTDNTFGILADGGLVRVAATTVTDNVEGLAALEEFGGSIISRGNNTVEGNTTNGLFTGAFAPK